jgi:cell division protein FtsB
MQNQPESRPFPLRPAASGAGVTSAVGMQESAGRVRARRQSIFTQTVIWVTGLICLSFLLATLAQAWSNSQLMQRVQEAQQQEQQLQQHHNALEQAAKYYNNPFVLESEARQQLGYIRPGEHAVIVVSPASPPTQSAPRHSAPAHTQGFWQDWWNIFFGLGG